MSKIDPIPSPAPWRPCGPYSLCADGEGSIVTCSGPNKAANLARIAQAVNSHDELLAVCEMLMDYFDPFTTFQPEADELEMRYKLEQAVAKAKERYDVHT